MSGNLKIGLLDVDSHNFPNLVLMKISSYYKALGHQVEWMNHFERYDIAYKSKVFTFTQDDNTIINAEQVIVGGTGYNIKNKLPSDIENIYPDYSLYNIQNTAYGYLTRGCPRKCEFCIVSEKEGCSSIKVSSLEQFWKGQKEIRLLDPNILASKDKEELLLQLIDVKQGLIEPLHCGECNYCKANKKAKIRSFKSLYGR